MRTELLKSWRLNELWSNEFVVDISLLEKRSLEARRCEMLPLIRFRDDMSSLKSRR